MKGGDHHYSRACCSNCANASYLLSFTSTPPYSHVSHFLFFRLHNDQKSLLQKVLFRDCIGFHCYSLQMALRWAPEATLKRSFCLHTRRAAVSDNTNCGRPTLLTLPATRHLLSDSLSLPYRSLRKRQQDPFCWQDIMSPLWIGTQCVHSSHLNVLLYQ